MQWESEEVAVGAWERPWGNSPVSRQGFERERESEQECRNDPLEVQAEATCEYRIPKTFACLSFHQVCQG